jgi:hypothetical protein
MTERKPAGVSWEWWIEGQIREAMERGEFDDLAGAGKPLPNIDQAHDEMWWLKEKLRRENVSFLPPALAVRREIEEALDRIAKADTESAVRQIVAVINERIVQVNSRTTSGPASAATATSRPSRPDSCWPARLTWEPTRSSLRGALTRVRRPS